MLDVVPNADALGSDWDGLLSPRAGLQASRAWLAATIAAALPAGAEPRLLAFADGAGPLALIPMLAGPGRSWGSLTTPYTCLYQPACRPDALDRTLSAFGEACRRWPVTRIEALDPAWPGVAMLRRSLEAAGLITRSFAHFGNWHESIAPGAWDRYLQARPGALRETIRRRGRAAERAGLRIEIARESDALAAALAAYEDVYRRSWKEPEPFPEFNAALVRALAEEGVLRIGVMWKGHTPIAAQYWSVADNAATVLKLAHDSAFQALSPGTVLTAATIRELIEVDLVSELDFGRGDDAYKRNWASCRRPRIGLLGLNVRKPAGLLAWAAHDGGRAVRRARASIRSSVRTRQTRMSG